MARRGLATALQAALAGFGGYGQGVVAQRERAQKLTQAEEERKRREMLDILDLQERTYMRPEQLVQAREKAAAPTSRVVQSAILSALSPTRPAPLPSTEDIADVMATSALRQPLSSEQRITAYGQEYVRPEAPILTERRQQGMERAQKMFESAAERRARQEELAYQRARDKQADELAGKRYDLEVKRYGLEERRVAASEKTAAQRQADSEWRLTKLPAAAQAKLAGFESGVLMASNVRSQITSNPDAVGLKNLAWGPLVDRLDPQGVGVRASIEALSGEIRNLRFGGQLTDSEAKLAESFLPGMTDRSDNALSKLQQLENFLELKKKGIYMVYGGTYQPTIGGGSARSRLEARAGGEE